MNFLKNVAKSIFSNHTLEELQNVCVVLPTRRSVFFLKEYMSELSETPFIAPEVFAIDDFVLRMSNVALIDNVNLLFKTYEIFKTFDDSVEFDKFITWAPTLLKDFDVIDQYIVENPKSIFDYMSEAESIKRWEVSIGSHEKLHQSSIKLKYFQLYENIYKVYLKLQEELLQSGLAYRGLAYKHLASTIGEDMLKSSYSKFYFAGFNAFSKSEEKILSVLMASGKMETFWDIDEYLIDKKYDHRGGKLIRSYAKSKKFGNINWTSNNLLNDSKTINIIGVENTSLQSKVAGSLYTHGKSTAIVLADENQLQALVYSLPQNVKDFNITMGLSLENSSLYTLIESIFELQQNIVEFANKAGEIIKIRKFNHRHVLKILNHPLVRRYVDLKIGEVSLNSDFVIRKLISKIYAQKAVFMSEKDLLGFMEDVWDDNVGLDLLKILFSEWKGDTNNATKTFYNLFEEFIATLNPTEDAVELEFLYLFLTILNKFEKLLANKSINLKNFRYFLFELIKIEKIPFNGEPISELQIMGMLETRCLDFDRVIILSLNEGILPAGSVAKSLIPYDASIAHGLPVHTDKDAVMSYHFFRLLQRAKEIDLLYVFPSGEGSGIKEKSRFILQIENELSKLNKNIIINYPKVKLKINDEISEIYNNSIEIEKNDEMLKQLSLQLSKKGISASSINTYMTCTLKYYFTYILGLGDQEMGNTLETNEFGILMHEVFEEVDKSLKDGEINLANIDDIILRAGKILDDLYQKKLGGYVLNSGMNILLKHVAHQLLVDFFKMQKEKERLPIKVLGNEVPFRVAFKLMGEREMELIISGKIDRIEAFQNTIIVADYKTGKVESRDLKIDSNVNLRDVFLKPQNDKIRQLWIYQYLLWKTFESNPDKVQFLKADSVLKSKIYSMRNLKDDLEFHLTLNKDEFIQKTEEFFSEIVNELLNPEISFKQVSDINTCKYCDFKGICNSVKKY